MARQFSRGARRKTQWAGFGDEAGTAAFGSMLALTAGTPVILSVGMIIGGAAGFFDEEVTITRMIGTVTALLNSVAAGAQARVGIGCYVADQVAITAGVASLPSPEDSPDSEWLYYAQFDLTNPITSPTEGQISVNARVVDFDVRGQRIVRAGESPVWIAESETSGVIIGVGGRYLGKLT